MSSMAFECKYKEARNKIWHRESRENLSWQKACTLLMSISSSSIRAQLIKQKASVKLLRLMKHSYTGIKAAADKFLQS